MAVNPMDLKPRPAVFLDKDGTLVEDVPYNVDPARLRLVAGAGECLRRLRAAGYLLVMVTNQPGIALGKFSRADLERLRVALHERLADDGVSLDGFYFCPHAAGERGPRCACRKPRPGMLVRAARELDIDLSRSWMAGDILDDIEAGRRAGCRTALVDVGSETCWQPAAHRVPHAWVSNLRALADAIVEPDQPARESHAC